MIGAQFRVRTVSSPRFFADHPNASLPIAFLLPSSTSHSPIRLDCRTTRRRPPNSALISCHYARGNFDPQPSRGDDRHHDFLEASLLLSETVLHYRMLRHGLHESMKWQSSRQLLPFSVRTKDSRSEVSSIGLGFLNRFQSPTIFLKISCDGDFLLPIIVGEFAVEKLVEGLWGDDIGDCPDQFQFVKNVVEKLGYEVKMVRITERVANTYFAKLDIGKPGENEILSLDARPSDAINVANRCKAPIYVNKQIVLADAIRIGYGMGRVRSTKSTYDVSLDSAIDGPDLLTEELGLVRNMHLAVKEERYLDAAMLRDKLMELRNSTLD